MSCAGRGGSASILSAGVGHALSVVRHIGSSHRCRQLLWLCRNRMLYAYGRENQLMLLEGASPTQIDDALKRFGMAMGQCVVTWPDSMWV